MPATSLDRPAFDDLESACSVYGAKGRAQSASLLLWFLEHILRLDEVEAQDAVCDASGDQGIDGLIVSEVDREIILLQSRRKKQLKGTLGDSDLRTFVGSKVHFASGATVRNLISTTEGTELHRLLVSHKIDEKIDAQYTLRLVFACNAPCDDNARRYIAAATAQDVILDVWDLTRLAPVLRQLKREWFVQDRFRAKLERAHFFVEGPKASPNLVIAAIRAQDLIKLPGISDFRVFAQNVRLGLGRTRVNRDIDRAVSNEDEHARFLQFHNGLTIVARELSIGHNWLTMKNYSVCNGCQSLLSFWNNSSSLTPDLWVLVRLVKVGADRDLAESIAYRTNNQNPISLRDLSANDAVQLQLKAEFDGYFGDLCIYAIKRGAASALDELPNETAGQLLLALYNGKPWSAHQKYRIFEDFRVVIFRYGRTAPQIRLAQLLMTLVQAELSEIKNERIRKYGLTRFVALWLVGEVLRLSPDGGSLLDSPLPYLRIRDDVGRDFENQLCEHLRPIVSSIVVDLDVAFEERGTGFDYKSALKSEKEVMSIRMEVLRGLKKDLRTGRMSAFTLPVKHHTARKKK